MKLFTHRATEAKREEQLKKFQVLTESLKRYGVWLDVDYPPQKLHDRKIRYVVWVLILSG